MTDIINSAIRKIKAKVGFHGVSDTDVLKAGNTAYSGLLNNPAYPTRRSSCRISGRLLTALVR